MIRIDLKALLYSLEELSLSFETACFINGDFCADVLEKLPPSKTDIITPFAPLSHAFKEQGYQCSILIPEIKKYDLCCVLLPKQKDYMLHDLAMAFTHLKEGGALVVCAAKDAGGLRLSKILKDFGLEVSDSFSKHHCKCLVAYKTPVTSQKFIDQCLENGRMQINQYGFHVKPGVFGWNKIDVGSDVLSQYLPNDLRGKGADFGCGYGMLTDQVFLKNPSVKHMICIDIDSHAVQSCQKNIEECHSHRSFEIVWTDITRERAYLESFDFIVMNPPFHSGKDQDISSGQDMIQAAYKNLKKGGNLFMVANAHLPYERLLQTLFFKTETLMQEKGFKVFKAFKKRN